jgi:RNA polymerase sigma-70 factor (ECF subfamily)
MQEGRQTGRFLKGFVVRSRTTHKQTAWTPLTSWFGRKADWTAIHATELDGQDLHKEPRMDVTEDGSALVARSRNGDHSAYATLIQIHHRMIHSLAYRMTGSLADADDLAQETFVRAYEHLDTYQDNRKFSTWLYRIALNACLDFKREEARRGRIHAGWSDAADSASFQEAEKPAEEKLGDPVQGALLRLPTKQRIAIVLTLFDGLSHAEAAQALGCSEATVSWRVFAARRKLRRWLGDSKGKR